MARAPDQRVEQAKALYDKGLKLIDIASQLGIPEGTVRSWKNRYNWDCNVAKEKRNVAKRKGGQPGNKNAEGHGGTGPPRNKNAVKTGEFETLFFDTLNPEEKRLVAMVQAEVTMIPQNYVELTAEEDITNINRILDLLDDDDDVQEVYHNWDE